MKTEVAMMKKKPELDYSIKIDLGPALRAWEQANFFCGKAHNLHEFKKLFL